MCGIAVIVGEEQPKPELTHIVGFLKHRGPDAEGTWTSPSGLCVLGHCRLSIIDLSDAGRQPMHSTDGRFHIVFNGEIYNYLELREELGGTSASMPTISNRFLLTACVRWSEVCLDPLVGRRCQRPTTETLPDFHGEPDGLWLR